MTEKDFIELLAKKTENRSLDFKERFNWDSATKEEKGALVKDMLALTNTQDGGYILFGIRDADYEFIGVSEEEFAGFDVTKVNDFLHTYADPKFSCEVSKFNIGGKLATAIHVPEFLETPNICKTTLNSSQNKVILQAGAVYIRTDSGKSTAAGAHEMRELLGRAVIKRGDVLLEDIRRLIIGKPLVPEQSVEDLYAPEIKAAEDYLYGTIGSKFMHYGGWELCAYPTSYKKTRIAEPQEVKRLVSASQVRLRGWYFPHSDKANAKYFNDGFQSTTAWERYHEGYRAYQSGLFVWKRILPEDLEEMKDKDGRRILSFIGAIWEVTEIFLFLKRYYEAQPTVEGVRVRLALNGTLKRALASLDFGIRLDDGMICAEPCIEIRQDISVAELKASAEELANKVMRRIFLMFDWDDAEEEMVRGHQRKLIERKF